MFQIQFCIHTMMIFFILICCKNSYSQVNTELLQEILLQQANGDLSETTEYTELLDLIDQPIDINHCIEEDLDQIPFLTRKQVHEIINYRDLIGDFIDIHELQAIPGLPLDILNKIRPFITIKATYDNWPTVQLLKQEGKQEFTVRIKTILEKQKGYISDSEAGKKYEGNNSGILFRYKYSFGNKIQWGIGGEKDPGEAFFRRSNPQGFDQYSYYFIARQLHPLLSKICLGDFKYNIGQGLTTFSGFHSSKGNEVMSIMNSSKVLDKSGTIRENKHLKGIGIESRYKNYQWNLIFSTTAADARIDTSLNGGNESYHIKSIPVSGFHRTETEIEYENAIRTYIGGSYFKYVSDNASIGINFLTRWYNYKFDQPNELYKHFKEDKKKLHNIGLDYHVAFQNIFIAGEVAFSDFRSFAITNKVQASLSKNMDFAIVGRAFSRDFSSIMGSSFGESTNVNNEHGVYLACSYFPTSKLTLQGFVDIWSFPWLKFGIDTPSKGLEYRLKINYKKKRKLEAYVTISRELKAKNWTPLNSPTHQIQHKPKSRIRLHVNNKITKELELRSRLELASSTIKNKNIGYLIYQDLIWKPLEFPFTFTSRMAYFDSPDYDNRIYAYENDLLYHFSIPSFYKNGFRFYMNGRVKLGRSLSIGARISRSFYPFEHEISSGNEKIDQNHKTELKFQLRYKF